MGKKYTTDIISIGDHSLDAPGMVQIDALIADGLHSEAGYLTEESGTTKLTDAEIAEMGYIKTYTQLTSAEIAAMGYLTEMPSHSHNYLHHSSSAQLADIDLDSISTSGVYQSAGTYASNSNIPYANYFTMLHLDNAVSRAAQLWFGDSPGRMYYRPKQGANTWHPWEHVITSSGISQTKTGLLQSNASLRAPVFYDSNDTNYYLNPAGTSTLNVINATGGTSTNWNTAHGWGNHADAGYLTSYNDTNTWRGIHDTPVDGETTISISSNWAFDNVKTAVPAGALFTDTDTTYVSSDFTHNDLTGYDSNVHRDWALDQGATNIHIGNYTQRPISSTPADGQADVAISSDWAFDNVKTAVPAGALFTDTNTTYDLSGLMPKQFATSYSVIPTGGWSAYNLGNGTMAQSSSVGKPSGATHGYWFNLGRRDAGGGYVGMYVNSYQNAGSGIYIGRSTTSAADPTWEKVWTNLTDGSGSGLDADLLDGNQGDYYYPASNPNNYTTTDWTTDQGDTNIHSGNYTNTDTNTQLTDAQIAGMGYIKTYTDTNTNTQLTTAQIEAMGYIKSSDEQRAGDVFWDINSRGLSSAEIRKALNTTNSNVNAVDDPYAPEGGCFEVTGPVSIQSNEYWKIDTASTYHFEVWIKYVSGADTSGLFYAGWSAYSASKSYFGNTNRYWASSAEGFDADTRNDGAWHKVVGRIGPGQFTNGTRYAKPIILLNYATDSTTKIRYCGLKMYRSDEKLVSTIRQMNNSAYNGTVDGHITTFLDSVGNVKTAGTIESEAFIKTPTFYDLDDTGYYVNPASTSNLSVLKSQEIRTAGSLSVGSLSDISGSSGVTSGVITFSGLATDSVNNYSIQTRKENYGGDYNKLDLSFHTGIRLGAHPNYGGVRFYTDQTMTTEILAVGKSGTHVQAANSLRAPVFYDSNDTGYYLNPNSDSNLYRGKFRANDQADNNYTLAALWTQNYNSGPAGIAFHISGNVGKLLEMRTNGILYWNNSEVLTTSSGYLPLSGGILSGDITVGNGQTSSNIYMADSDGTARRIHTNSNRIGFLTSGNSWGSYCTNNGDWKTDTISYAGASMRAPTFYDSNNTAYVVNPASTSTFANINAANFYGMLTGTASNANLLDNINSTQFMRSDVTDTFFPGGTSALAVENQGTFTRLAFNELRFYEWDSGGDNLILNNGHVSSDSSFRAPIFYDSNDTNYYLDPNSASYLNNVYGNRFSVPISNLITIGDNAATYTYKDTTTRSILYASSAYPALVLNSTASSNPNHGPTIQFSHNGHDSNRQWVIGSGGTGQQLDFGTAQASNRNPHVGIGSYQGITCMRMTVAGNVGIGGTWGFQGSIANPAYDLHVQGNAVATTSSRAPIFYDLNNTTYYTNPAGTSIVQRITHINHTTPILIKVNSGYRSWVHHVSTSSTYHFAPSATNGAEDWDWANQMSITTGGVVTANNFVLASDKRSKTKIKDLTSDNIDVSWKSFEMKGNEGEYRTGVIAQELEENHPEFVNTDEKGFKSVKYIDLLIAKIAELEARLEKLEK